MQKKLGIYFQEEGKSAYPFGNRLYLESYLELISFLESNNIDVYIIRGESYKEGRVFDYGWKHFVNNKGENDFEKILNIEIDLLLNRAGEGIYSMIDTILPVINTKEISELCGDKRNIISVFPNLVPYTQVLYNYNDFITLLDRRNINRDDIIVLKRNFSLHGDGVIIRPVSEITQKDFPKGEEILFQDFIDSSKGIPGIIEGLHDLRINIVNGIAVQGFIRTPEEGCLLSNVAQGGSVHAVELNKLPKALFNQLEDIIKYINKLDKTHVFAADFVYANNRFYLIELNAWAGLGHKEKTYNYWDYNSAIGNMILDYLKKLK